MRINFDFTDLEVFLAVMDAESFHLASERLGLSQSSVTRRIQKLEESLDAVLFQRTTRHIKPTLAAKRLRQRAEIILTEVRETTVSLRDESVAYAYQKASSITVATIPTVVAGLVGPAIARHRTLFSGTRYRFMDLAANEVAEAVFEGDADIGIASLPMLQSSLVFELLFKDPIVIALNTDHELAKAPVLSWEEILQQSLILPARGTGNRVMIDDALAATGLPVTWTIEVGRTTTALELVREGLGIAPLPQSSLLRAETKGIVARAVGEPEILRPVGIMLLPSRQMDKSVTAFMQCLRAEAVSLAES